MKSNYKDVTLSADAIIRKLDNKESFFIVAGANWCPPCNEIKYGVKEYTVVNSGTVGILEAYKDKFVLFGEDVTITMWDDMANDPLINSQLWPFFAKLKEYGVDDFENITWQFVAGELVKGHTGGPNRTRIPVVIKVINGKVTRYYVYPSTKEELDIAFE